VLFTICSHTNREAHVTGRPNFNCFIEVIDFSRSQAGTYTVKVEISRKRCKVETSIVITTDQ